MNKTRYNRLKDLVYEFEGLLELLQLRPEKMDDLMHLLTGRLDAINAEMSAITAEKPATATKPTYIPESEPENVVNKEEDIAGVTEAEEKIEPISQLQEAEEDPEVPVESDEPVHVDMQEISDMQSGNKHSRPLFCLNDRFRFCKTLFAGDNAEFDATMTRVASMDSIEEAEEYFYEDMGLSPESQEVQDFMEIISNYLKR